MKDYYQNISWVLTLDFVFLKINLVIIQKDYSLPYYKERLNTILLLMAKNVFCLLIFQFDGQYLFVESNQQQLIPLFSFPVNYFATIPCVARTFVQKLYRYWIV
jgi:hypothetical protein